MDINALHNCFAATLDADINNRRRAELELREANKQPGFINGCLDIVLEPQVSQPVQAAAAVYLKNRINHYWEPFETTAKEKINEAEKPIFRERIIPALIKVSPSIRPVLVSVLNSIVSNDYPKQWPELLDITLGLFQNHDIPSIHAGLTCLLEITRYYRWTTGEARAGLDRVIEIAFPGVLSVGTSLVQENNPAAGDMLRDVLKIYKMASYQQLPVLLQQRESVVGWGSLFLQVIRKELPSDVMDLDEDDRDLNSWVKCKKWSYANLYRLFSKYVITTRLSEKEKNYKEFSEMFINDFVPEILKAYFEQIQGWIEKRIWISKACLYNILSFFEECIVMKSTWILLKPHSETLVNYVIFPLLCPSDSDLETFEDEPEEYIHERIDIFEESPTPDIAATNFLLRLVRKRKKTVFTPLLTFIQGVVQQHVANQTDLELSRKKEGALRMLGSISYIVLNKKSPIADQMESFIVQYVFPDFNSPFGFLRARACEFLNRYADLEFKSVDNISVVYQSVLKCMDDKHLPVQVEAALALQPMIRHDSIRAALSTKIPEVMQHLLNLGNKIDIDALSGVMEEFVEVFSEQLTPFSVELAQQMTDQFLRIANELFEKYNYVADITNYDDSAHEEKTMAALGILNTLTSLLLALDNASEIVLKLEEVFMPIFALVLGKQLSEFYSEVWGLAENITFTIKQISPNMWQVYKLIHESLRDFGYDYLEEVLPCFSNYIQYGVDNLNGDNLQLMYEIIEHVMTDSETLGAADRQVACNLAIRLLTASKGYIDDYVQRLLELVISRLQSNESQLKSLSYNIYLLEVIISSLYYNPTATLVYLEQCNYTAGFFSSWFEKIDKFTRVQDKKVSILALLAIFTLPDEQIPESIRNNLPQLSKGLISIINTLPKAVENKESLAKEYDSIEGYDDIYSGVDDDEWAEDEEVQNEEDLSDPASSEYLNYLSSQAIKLDDHEFYDKDDEELEEEVFEETPLDPINAYMVFRNTLLNLNQTNQQRYLLLTNQFTAEDKQVVDKIFDLALKTESKQT